jgi:hypothetical protein
MAAFPFASCNRLSDILPTEKLFAARGATVITFGILPQESLSYATGSL